MCIGDGGGEELSGQGKSVNVEHRDEGAQPGKKVREIWEEDVVGSTETSN